MAADGEAQDPISKEALLESLQDATKRLAAAEKVKRADAAVHNETIGSTKAEIKEIIEQLDSLYGE